MAVAYTNTYGTSDYIAPQSGEVPNSLQILYKVINVTTAFANTNTVDIGYLPKGAICVGGYMALEDLDTGTETLDIDCGVTANTGVGGTEAADPDFFTNAGVLSGDAVGSGDGTRVLTNAAQVREFLGPFPVLQLSAKTLVQLVCNAAANATGTGKIVVRVDYICPGSATS